MMPRDATAPDPVEVLARHGRSFHFASHFLGRRRARDCARLYAFCRFLDDLADDRDRSSSANTALAAIADQVMAGRPEDAMVRDFLDLARCYDLDPAVVLELIRGLRSDCGAVAVADEAELLRYAYRVAGTVGVMVTPILGARSRPALPHAIDLGIAMQLTNIARDVRDDATLNRRYLPATWVGELDARALLDPSEETRASVGLAVFRLLDLADRYYASAEAGLRYLPPGSRFAIAVAARCYRAIGGRLRDRKPEWWQGRAVVSTPRKCGIALLQAVPRAFAFGSGPAHEGPLHRALTDMPYANG